MLQSEKEKTLTAKDMIEECRDKLRQAEQERDYALSHQKKVEIPVEKPVLYQKCGNCKPTASSRRTKEGGVTHGWFHEGHQAAH